MAYRMLRQKAGGGNWSERVGSRWFYKISDRDEPFLVVKPLSLLCLVKKSRLIRLCTYLTVQN